MAGSSKKKAIQLGMPHGTAEGRLRKMILFYLLWKYDDNWCYQCGEKIVEVSDLSIEHKQPWLDVSPLLFWDLDNIAFSHLNCNTRAAKRTGGWDTRRANLAALAK